MRQFSRADRVSGQIQRELSQLLKKDVKDPRLETAVITDIRLSRDLRSAKVYFTSGGLQNRERAQAGFQQALGFIKRRLAKCLDLRYMPDLKFFYDETLEYGIHINGILKSISSDETDSDATEKL